MYEREERERRGEEERRRRRKEEDHGMHFKTRTHTSKSGGKNICGIITLAPALAQCSKPACPPGPYSEWFGAHEEPLGHPVGL